VPEPDDPYLAHRDVIDRAIDVTCRRHRLSRDEAEEFGSTVRLHLVESDYAVLKAFAGRSSLQTYLLTVIAHRFQDWRNAQWGKWRPSAEARRCGPLAVRLETLVLRDGLSFEEALELLRTNHGVSESRESLEALLTRLPVRTRRRSVGEETLRDHETATPNPHGLLRSAQATTLAQQAAQVLEAALAGLQNQDRLILRMRFEDDLRLSDIGRMLGLDQKQLYRRVDASLRQLRAALLEAGIAATDASEILEHRGLESVETRALGPENSADVRPTDHAVRSAAPGRLP